ncbi:MAG: diguanylate cyclase [Oscillospiraceae bacterium]|nr:diguanylate cyclase [Oscillospiraceae bacterium]
MTKRKQTYLHAGTIAFLTTLTLALIFLAFRNRMTAQFQQENEAHLADNAATISAVFYTKLDDQLTMLESQSRYFQNIDLSDYNAMKNTILTTKGVGGFKTIGVANSSGATINYNGTSSGNIYLNNYYQEAMLGQNAISESTIIDEEGDEVLVLAVPIRKLEGISGVIYGTFTKTTLDSLLDSVTTTNDAAHMLLNADGEILARTSAGPISRNAVELSDVIPNTIFPTNGGSQVIYYTAENKHYIAVLVPIGVHGWYFANILPEDAVSSQTRPFLVYLALAIGGVSLVFLGVMIYLLSLLRHNDDISDVNERFRLAAAQSHNLVFAYNYKTATMTIEGNAKLLIQNAKPVYTRTDIEHLFEQVHYEDQNICSEITALAGSQQTSFMREFRLKCTDSCFYWFRMNATVIRDEHGHPLQLIGSLFNVDEQINKEIMLIERAQTDSLTGILNKGSFQAKLCKELEDRAPSACAALFIVDLDDFKKVNDQLGHAMGDQVLIDVSSKLSTIFGSKTVVGRIGGDEFAAYLIMNGIQEDEADLLIRQRASLICSQLQESYSAYKIEVDISASVGIAVCPRNGSDYDTLYRKADQAMYSVKGTGKSKYALYSEGESS